MKKSSRSRPQSGERNLLALAVASCFATGAAFAAGPVLPNGPTVINGQVFFNYNGNLLQITNTPGAVINWQGFSIGASEITRFIQQSASSAVLNRVTAGNPSVILGALQSQLANGTTGGRVYLINPSGVVFGAGAQINTGGLVVSTLGLSDADFAAGRHRFTEIQGAGGIVNQGKITTPTGGSIYLVAPNIVNSGIIRSDGGEIILAAGKSVDIVSSNSPDVRVTITAPDNEAVNLGQIIAQGGKIGIYGGLIRQAGVVNANTAVRGENGKIVFKATKDVTLEAGSSTTASGPTAGSISIQSDAGKAVVAGAVEANATQGKGGTIAVAAQQGVSVEPTGTIAANGVEGGSVTLSSTGGSVAVAGTVSANATRGRAGEIALIAATDASLASTAQVSAGGGLGSGSVSIKAGKSIALDTGSKVVVNGAVGGTVAVQSEQSTVAVQGTIDATGSDGAGGNVEIAAASDITLDDSSRLLVSGLSGGTVKVQSGDGSLLASGLIDGQGNEGPGGLVWLLAPRVGLVRQGVVNASGRTGGGTVLVGGDYHGANPGVQNAWRTYVGAGVVISADALNNGNGGRVIVWADDTARFYGSISARGAGASGNGGLSEVSGKNVLDFKGAVNLNAPHGTAGTLLLDPRDLDITTGTDNQLSGTGPETDPWISIGGSSQLNVTMLETQLGSSSVLIQTGGTGGGNGDINVLNTVTAPANGNTLTLQAHRDIVLNTAGRALDFSASSGNVILMADAVATDGVGAIINGTGTSSIGMGSGALVLTAGSGVGTVGAPILTTGLSTLAATTGTGGIFVSNSAGGNVTVGSVTYPGAGNSVLGTLFGGTVIGVATTAANNSGSISVDNQAPTGTIIVSQPITTVGSTTGATGGITLTTAGGDVAINAALTTGDSGATPDGTSAQSGAISVTAGGSGAIFGTGSATTGLATVTAGASADTATAGNISLNAAKVSRTAGAAATDRFAITLGAASGASTSNLDGLLTAITTGAAGNAGGLFATTAGALRLGAITTSGGNVDVATTGAGAVLTATGNIDTTNATPTGASITLTADDMDLTALAANSIRAGSGANTVVLKPNAANRTINITSGSTGQLDLSPTELQTVSVAGGTLQLGATGATGDINLNATLTSANVNAGTLKLLSGQNVNITGGQDIGAAGTEFDHNLDLTAAGSVNITNGNVYLADNRNLTVTATGSVNVGGDTVQVGTTGANTGSMAITGRSISLGSSGGPEVIAVTGAGAQTFSANGAGGTGHIDIINSANSTVSITADSGTQTFDTTATTGGNGNLLIQSSNTGAANGNVLIKSAAGAQSITLNGGLTVQNGGASSSASATAILSADSGQTINAKYVEVTGQGAALATISNDTTTGNATNQAITVTGVNASGESIVVKALGTGGATIQNGIAASTGKQDILIDGAGANLLRVTGTASDARILANGTGAAGNQQNITVNTGTSNAIEIGDVAAGATAGISGIIGGNQTVVADTLTIRGGTGVTKHSQLVNNAGAQNVTLGGTLTLVGGTAVGAVTGCAPASGGSCAFVSNNGAGLQHITANKIDMQGGDIGGVTGIHNTAGIFVNAGNMQLDVGAGGLVMLGGNGDPTAVTGGDNSSTIGGSGADGRTLTLNFAGNTTLTGGTTEGSSAFIGLGGSGSGQSVTVTFTGTTGDVSLNGSSGLNAGAAIGAGRQQDNATADVTVTGKNITLNPGTVGVARLGHSALAVNGGGNVSVTATGGDINLSNGAGAASYILTTGNVTLQASSAGKIINEQTGGYVGANSLTAVADSGITLTGSNNAVSSFSATNSSANAISLKNTIALDIAAGNVTNAGRNVTLNNTGAVTDTGAIVAGGLELLGSGPYTLDSSANSVTTLAANITGAGNSLTYVNAGALTVGTVNTTGITTATNPSGNSGGVTLSTVAGAILVSQAVSTGAATVATTGSATVNSGAISLTAGGSGNVIGTATVTTGSVTVTGGVAGENATAGNITLAGNRVAQAAAGATPFSVVFGAANAGGGTSNQGRLNAASDGVGAAGDIRISSSTSLFINAITSTDPGALISIATTGGNNLTNVGTITGPGGITLNAGAGMFDNSGGTLTTGNTNNAISITANDWILGAGANQITTGASGGVINIDRTAGAQISLGTALTSAELATVTTSGNFTIGSATNSGGVDIAANVTFAGTTPKVKLFSGLGSITDAGGANAITATNLDLTAKTGVGSAGNAIKTTASGNLSATNTTSGNIYLASTAGVTLGGGSAVIDEQVLNGTISVAAGGAIDIAGNMSVSGGGNSQILLNATGNIARSGGTVTAKDITLSATTAGSGVGTSGAPVFTAASGALTLTAGTGGAFVNNTGSVTLATPTLGVSAPITVTSTGSLTLPAFAFNTGAGSMDFESNGGTLTTVAALTTTTGNITLVGSAGITLGHDLATAGGNIQLTGATTLAGPRLLTSAGGGITFNGALAGAGNNLTVSAGATGNVGFTGAVGNVPLLTITNANNTTFSNSLGAGTAGAVTIANSAGTVDFQGSTHITTLTMAAQPYNILFTGGANTLDTATTFVNTGNVTLVSGANTTTFTLGVDTSSAPAATNIGGTLNTAGGTQIKLGPTTLTAAATLNAGAGNVTFNGTVNGGQALAVNSTGTTLFSGIVGGGTALTSVTTNAGGTTVLNGGAVTTTGAQTYSDAVTLATGTTLNGVNVSFNNTLNSAGANRTLAVNDSGTTIFGGVVGGGLALASITTNAGGTTALNGGAVTTTGAQTYNDAVSLGAGTTLNAVNVSFNGTVNGGRTLTVNDSGMTTFGGVVGGGTALTSVTMNSGGTTAINGGAITTTGAQNYNEAVTLGAGTTLNGANVNFSTTLDSAGANRAVVVNDSGTTTFGGLVGGTLALTSITTNAGGTTAINGGAVTTTGAQTYNDAVTLGAATTFSGVNVNFANTLNSAGANRTLVVNDSGTTTFGGVVGGTLALTSITINAGGTTALNGGAITTAGAQIYNDAVNLGAGATLTSTGGGAIFFGSTVDGANSLTVNTAGATTFAGAVGGTTPLTTLATNAGGTTQINGGSVNSTGDQIYGDATTVGAATTFNATNPAAKIAFNSSLTANANALTISADEIDFNGGINSVSGTSTIHLQPNNANAAIWLGTAADAGPHANELDLTTADLAALNAGFTGVGLSRPVTVGQNAGTHTITIGTSTFNDSVLIQAPVGAGNIQWYLSSGTPILSAPNIDFNVPGQIGGGGIVNASPAGSLKIIQSGGIGAPGAPLVTHVSNLEAANSGSGDVYIQNDRDITLVNQFINNVPSKILWLETTNGSINTGTAVVSVAGGAGSQIVLSASDAGVAGGANITVSPLGISSNGGTIALHAADNINVNGGLNSNNGNIEIIAGARGNVGGSSTWIPGLLNGPLVLPAMEAVADTAGMITLNALINAGPVPATAGNVVLIAASQWDGTSSTSATNDAIVQTATGAIRAKDLTAVALRGSGGQFLGGGAIRLNVANAPLNATMNVNLFACAVAGCPDSTPTRAGAPFATASMIKEIAAPPVGTYADGPLFYTSSGTNISGVGTVNDFITYTTGNYSLSGATMSGRNLTFEGDGDVDINLTTLIDNTKISNGGTVKFVAGGNIRYNPFAAGATFGSAASPLSNRNLEFYAAGNIDLNNAINIGPTGNLVANANTAVTFITPSPPSPVGQSLPASGTGDVTLRGNHEIVVGDNFTLNARNLNILGGDLGSPNQQQLGERLNVGGTVTINLTGNLNLTGGTATANSASAALINAGNVTLGGALQNIMLAAGSDGGLNKPADARILATNNVSIATAGNLTLDALTGGSNSSATIGGGNVSIGSAGAPVNSIVLKGGTSLVTGATPQIQNADATITAGGGLSAYIGGGGLTMTGGSATVMASAGATAQATAAAGLKGGSVTLNVGQLGNVLMTGGTSLAQQGLSASISDLSADASTSIVSAASFSPTIAGSLTMQGGTATAGPASAHASSAALVDGGTDLTLNVGTGLTLTGGTAVANGGTGACTGGGGACTNVSALLSSKSGKAISVATGDVNFTGGSATANGSSASSSAFAGADSGSVAGTLATLVTLDVMTGRITLTGGPQSGTGGLNSDAAILSVGGVKIFGHSSGVYSGLTLNGQFGSGLFQNLLSTGTIVRLDGSVPPVSVVGGVTICPAWGAACVLGATYGNSFVLSGSPPSNLDPLLSGLMSSIEMSKLNRIAGFLDDVNQGSRRASDKNYCK